MITTEQLRAARALLNWNQDDLAAASKISKAAINNIERGAANPRLETMRALQTALERAGIDFIDDGVRFRREVLEVKLMEGPDSATRLLWDVVATLRLRPDKELLVSGIQEQRFVDVCGDSFTEYLKQVREIGIQEKLLALENDSFFVTDVENYRWVPAQIFSQVPYFVYGDKYAIILWGPPQKIVLIENPAIAASYRQQFYGHWMQGRMPPIKKRPT